MDETDTDKLRRVHDGLRETYDLIAWDWHRAHADDDWWIAGTDRFAYALPTGGRVLDVGCGGGTKTKYLAARGLYPIGIDFSVGQLSIARREPTGIPFHNMRMTDAYAAFGRTFSGVFMQAVLLHVPKRDVPETLRQMVALLVPSGSLYVSVKERRPDQPEETVLEENDYGYAYRRFFSYFTFEEAVAAVRDAGTEIVHAAVTPSGNTRWIHVIGKAP